MQEIHVLHLEDDPAFADLVAHLLQEQGLKFLVRRAETWDDFESALGDGAFDLILSDHSVPGGDGLKALRLCRRLCPAVPFIFLSGLLGEELAVECLKNGAADYVLKTGMSRFIPTVLRALAAARETVALKAAEARIRRDRSNLVGLIENTTDAIWSMDLECNIIAFNSAASLMAMKMTGQPMAEGANFLDKLPPGARPLWESAAGRVGNRERYLEEQELAWRGGRLVMEISFHPITSADKVTGMAVFGRDMTERRRLELASREVEIQRGKLTGLYRKMRLPLHGLSRVASLLGQTALDDGQRRYVAMMGASARRLTEIFETTEVYEADLRALLPEGLHRSGASGTEGEAVPSEGGEKDFGSLRILIADDNAVNQIVVSAFLEKLGCRGDAVYNGKEALEACRARAYDLVLMDCQMPVMDGFTASEEIRRMEAASGGRVRIAAMTANVMNGVKEKCAAAGMDGYLSKPLKLEMLKLEMEKVLNSARRS